MHIGANGRYVIVTEIDNCKGRKRYTSYDGKVIVVQKYHGSIYILEYYVRNGRYIRKSVVVELQQIEIGQSVQQALVKNGNFVVTKNKILQVC